jgi:hypothetical protein
MPLELGFLMGQAKQPVYNSGRNAIWPRLAQPHLTYRPNGALKHTLQLVYDNSVPMARTEMRLMVRSTNLS